MLTGLNHITLAVADIDRSLKFYCELLGFAGQVKWQTGAYLSLNDLWLCLSLGSPSPAQDYSHIAFSTLADDFSHLEQLVAQRNIPRWQDNSSEGQSLYILDPDGHKLEVHLGDLNSRLKSLKVSPYKGLEWL